MRTENGVKNLLWKWKDGVVAVIIFFSLGGPSKGEEALLKAAAGPEKELEPYVVVGTRTPLPMERASPSISVLRSEEIERRQYRNLEEALGTLPGLTLAGAGQAGAATSLFSRGTNSDHTVFLLDGRKLNGGFSGNYNLAQLELDNIGKIEVMRGASSTLYGAEGIGGVVSLVQGRAGEEEGSDVSFRAEGGSFESHKESINLKWKHKFMAASLGASHYETANQSPNSHYRITNLMPRFEFMINEKVRLDLVGLYFESDLGTPDNRKSFVYPALEDFQANQSWMVSPGISIHFNDRLSARLFYARTEDRLEGRNVAFLFHTDSRTETDQAELQVDWQPNDGMTFTIGVDYLNQDFLQHDLQFGGTPFDNSWNSLSVFAQVQWELWEDLFLTAGGRFDNYSDFGSPATENFILNKEFPAFGISLFAKFATAYAVPQAFDLYGFFGNPDLDAEESDSWEFGLKQKIPSLSLHWSALYFRNNIENLITGFPLENVGKAVTEGLELSFAFAPSDRFQLYGNYTYLTAENRIDNTRLARRPRHEGMVGLRLTPFKPFTAGFEYRFVNGREDIDGGTFAPIDGENYSVARLYGEYRLTPKIVLFGRIENLFDEQYEEIDGFKALDRGAFIGARLSLH